MAKKRELAERLGAVPLFSRCSRRELQIVARHTEMAEMPQSTVLVTEGEKGDAFFVVLSGTARVSRGGRRRGTLEPGGYFGELALLDPAPRSATVTAETDVQVGVLGARMFRILLRELPAISERLLAGLARELREAQGSR
jgi:CRP-like cAMP-binding protein